ncbi:putative phospho-2-dehydro-3-deoxyheptonate aldolase [Vibrio nigripulchritudo SOn1]|uniref:Phospho-2-dehydro-3-deoxyheptonate aldolase n=1 Tax=Vibrio nigripulchritudo SOn1 TaxID=1238450 RepID=A0AAV2W0Z2_9VIBR|nr:3-deoxy-7-phosphoheptulonate synthase [Vibrio nigripulchritudo]CCO50242.1 putative phospho-2-dehydro-3-deoxyheptonate aldolase [Vibrio nigripulchritudo SOn1]
MSNNSLKSSEWQQPRWNCNNELMETVDILKKLPPIVNFDDITILYNALEKVWRREAVIFQAGDCAERFKDSDEKNVVNKLALLNELSSYFSLLVNKETVTVGRIAGQFAKPRSNIFEMVGSKKIPVWRGDNVNGFDQCGLARIHDPKRLYKSYMISSSTIQYMKGFLGKNKKVWTSHEALIIDYENNMIRSKTNKQDYLSSTHWPWIGIRTLGPNSPHVDLLSKVYNPISCKVSNNVSPQYIKELCLMLNSSRKPGRLTFISRFGCDKIDQLEPLVIAANETKIPVLWMCDPMHGNTSISPDGYKIRQTEDLISEVEHFCKILKKHDACNAGVHLEIKSGTIPECFGEGIFPTDADLKRIECDPRLVEPQIKSVLECWSKTAL